MGFQKVYDFLRKLYPEIDYRILRAVAIDNPNDVNEAVFDVLTEIIPRFYEETNLPAKDTSLEVASNMEVENKTKSDSDSEVGLTHVAPRKSSGLVYEDHDHKQIHQSHLNRVTQDFEGDKKLFDGVEGNLNDFHFHIFRDLNTVLVQESYCSKSHHDCSEDFNSQIVNPSFENHSPVRPEIQLHSEPDYQKSYANSASNASPKQECSTGEMSENEDQFMGNNSLITQSGELCRVELLDEIIEDAKSNKVFLFSAMESVIDKMRELEHKEKDVEKAREEAANGGSEITAKLEKLKRSVADAIEENDMLAGEVYGEKAILATETRELQSRLLILSDERDNSLSILDEMQATLEARIAAADVMLEAAQEVKLAKEEDARKALAEQDALMQKLVEQSVTLRQEEEENSKLRDFLMSRGDIVDMLQGEISVICQDVRHLKEKFDKKVPLSQSLSSSQTSCILASSGSSLKSSTAFKSALFCLPVNDIPSDLAYEKGMPPNTSKEGSRASSVSSSSSESLEEGGEINYSKAFSDDGWDVFDKDAELAEAPYLVDAKE